MYLRELTLHWRPLIAASVGMALGSALGHYTLSLFGPPLIEEFGWPRAQFALIGTLPLLFLFLTPFWGRFVDRFGARTAAMIGFTALPLGFVGFALMSGSIVEFFTIWVLQHVFAVLTTSLVFCRVVVERFDLARGIALSLMMSAPPLVGAVAAPALGALIDAEGWRAGYFTLAAITAVGGATAILLIGRHEKNTSHHSPKLSIPMSELMGILRNPAFALVVGGMFLVNVPQIFASSQLKLIVMDSGVSSATGTWMMSLYAIGVIVGRLLSGLALDRVAAHLVAIALLGLPAIGYLILAAEVTAVMLLAFSVAIIGFAQGAESDLGAYIVSKRFDMKNFSLMMSLLAAMIGAGSAAGSLILSATLTAHDSYAPFLIASAVATVLGAALFGLTGRLKRVAATAEAQA